MTATKGIVIIVLMLSLVACRPWPKHGRGGAAQVEATPFFPYHPHHPPIVSNEQVLQMRLLVARNQLGFLDIRGAKACFPGAWHQAQLQADRTVQEFAGGLNESAHDDLVILESKINRLNQRMKYVRNKMTCLPGPRRKRLASRGHK